MNRTLSKYSLLVPKVEVIRYLVERGADAAVQSKPGLTPINLASSSFMNMELIHSILEHGGDVTAQDKDGLTPLHLASGAPYPRCVPSPFMSKGNRWSGSLSTNYVELVRFLL